MCNFSSDVNELVRLARAGADIEHELRQALELVELEDPGNEYREARQALRDRQDLAALAFLERAMVGKSSHSPLIRELMGAMND